MAIEHQKIRIRLKALDSGFWTRRPVISSKRRVRRAPRSRADTPSDPYRAVHGQPVPPRRQESREQFESAPTSASSTSTSLPGATIDALMKLDLPAGVEVEIKL